MRFSLALIAAAALVACSGGDEELHELPPHARSLIIVGADGMDPVLLERLRAAGELPNLDALARGGSYAVLGTTEPPQSPVAWSTFQTGMDASGHGIYDFVHRDPHKLEPYLSTSRTAPATQLSLGSLALPIGGGEIELLRRGDTFWQLLEAAAVPARANAIPANFPPAPSRRNPSLSGMGTPDLLGTPGTFQYFTSEPAFLRKDESGAVSGIAVAGGIVHPVDFAGSQRFRGSLTGPPSPLSATGEAMTLPVDIVVDGDNPVALIRLGDAEVILEAGEWSEWVPIAFDPGLLGGDIGGMVRLYLGAVGEPFRLYVSPINIDPLEPAMPISSPGAYAAELARAGGRFYTQGMAEDTKAITAGALDAEEFLAQADLIWEERMRLLDAELDVFRGGALFFYFSSTDQVSHIFWRAMDDDAPPQLAGHADVVPELYRRVDRAVGHIRERAPDADIIVMSDHGFASYRRKVHLNSWLATHGYLALREAGDRGPGALGHIDWERTQAYALGLNQLFINRAGRESGGVVGDGDAESLIAEIERKLRMFRDPDTGARVVTQVVRGSGDAFSERVPDLIVGYNKGYRSSDESAIGAVGDVIIEDNTDWWSGDHCMDSALVPGIIITSFRAELGGAAPTLADLVPTTLAYFGVELPATMGGRTLFRGGETR